MESKSNDNNNNSSNVVQHKWVSKEEQSKIKRNTPPVSMCESVCVASLRCQEKHHKSVCKPFYEAVAKCKSIKRKLDDEENNINKYYNDATPLKQVTLQQRLEEIREEKSKQYPVPDVVMM
ncbi:hypothetical protein SAMD00019534_051340, partial [Acytostelium subglobosum LB1]|uniref:hypothetical protein n=1 Tax=Acytostelium subglobosum LB1 TaxID=1410327 RepID=UPI0006447DB1